jgi:hypothetical protein
MTLNRFNLLPFVETEQFQDFTITCDYACAHQCVALVYGPAGAGKSVSGIRYRDAQPLITANGLSPILYFQLTPADKTDRAFYNSMVEAMTRHPDQHRSAAAALAESKRLLQKYRYEALIIDEVGFLLESGLEAVRTLHDQTNLPIILITMPQLIERLEQYPQFYSRIARFQEFGQLTQEQIRYAVLPGVSKQSHITFDAEQKDAEDLVASLYEGAGGVDDRGASFRDIGHILATANDLIEESIQLRDAFIAENPGKKPPKIELFNASLIRKAVARSKRRGKRENGRR